MGRSRGCIIRKNTKELRESLMSLRYRWLVKEKGANCIVTNPETLKYMELREKSVEAWKDEGWIDCGANDDMFLAIAALANNTDLGQWLIVTDATGDRWVECIESEFGKPKEILRSFDFTVTKMAYYKEPKYEEKEDDYFPFSSASIVAYEYKLLYHEKFFEHLHMKRLVIDENIPFPVSTWERSYRYKGYGYNMCRETKKKLLQAIKGVNVEEEDVSLYTTGGWD